jgi:diguanylate cyclase (GGDEF)-like protein/PAS domain S-box-containing protein
VAVALTDFPIPADERERLEELYRYEILDTPSEEFFDRLTKLAAQAFDVPIALISLVDRDRQWFKSHHGLEVTQTPRQQAFCAHTILSPEPLVVEDATVDPRFARNALVIDDPSIRFYAAVPLLTSRGFALGSLCVIDRRPRTVTAQQLSTLRLLAVQVVQQFELRQVAETLRRQSVSLTESRAFLERVESIACVGGFMVDLTTRRLYWTRQSYLIHEVEETREPTLELVHGFMSEETRSIVQNAERAALESGQTYDIEIPITTAKNHPIWMRVVGAVECIDGRPARIVGALEDITARHRAERALRSSEQRLQLISDNVPGLICQVDRDLHYKFVNRAYADWFGVEPSELLGMSVREFYGAQGFAGIEAPLRTALAGQRVTAEQEILARGVPRHCHVVLIPQRNRRDEVVGLFAIHTDITERRRAELALRASENFLARTGAIAGVGGWELNLQDGALTWSHETCRLHDVQPGFRPNVAEAINFYAPASRPVITEAVRNCIERGVPFDVELELISARGRSFWARATGAAEFEGGAAVRVAGAFQDVTTRRRMERKLADNHELLRVTLDSIGDAVITTDAQGRVEWLNPVAESMTGWKKEAGRGRALTEVFRIVNAETREPSINPIAVCLGEERVVGLASQTVLIARDGAEYHIEDSASPIRTSEGRILGAVLVFHDVSEQRRLSSEMTHRATHDALTGLLNRAEFEARLARLLAHARDEGTLHVLMYIDLDEFKVVNDACGHAAGDQLLRQVSALLEGCVRGRDTVARLGGDEFGLLLETCNMEQGQLIAQKICDHMEVYRFSHDGKRYRIGTSIGVVPVDERWSGTAAVLQAADSGCYAAKEAGRNRVHVWLDTDGNIRARHGEMQWVNRLVSAMDEGRFALFAQRIEPVQGGETGLHCEVLLRLREANGTLILPTAFLPAAERFHLASRIDRWVVGRVFGLLGSGAIDLCSIDMIAINLSGQSIGDQTFHRDIAKMITNAPFDVRKLCFEITETAAITHLGDARSFIDAMRAQGVRIALDDFGAGSSSFGYLRTLPVDFLKIDGQFITGFLDDPLDNAAVKCFSEVAKVVAVKTIAECVERQDIREALQRIGVDMVQGHLIHRAEPLEQVLSGKHSVIHRRGSPGKSVAKWRNATGAEGA